MENTKDLTATLPTYTLNAAETEALENATQHDISGAVQTRNKSVVMQQILTLYIHKAYEPDADLTVAPEDYFRLLCTAAGWSFKFDAPVPGMPGTTAEATFPGDKSPSTFKTVSSMVKKVWMVDGSLQFKIKELRERYNEILLGEKDQVAELLKAIDKLDEGDRTQLIDALNELNNA